MLPNLKADSVRNGGGCFEVDNLVDGTHKIVATAPRFETLLREKSGRALNAFSRGPKNT